MRSSDRLCSARRVKSRFSFFYSLLSRTIFDYSSIFTKFISCELCRIAAAISAVPRLYKLINGSVRLHKSLGRTENLGCGPNYNCELVRRFTQARPDVLTLISDYCIRYRSIYRLHGKTSSSGEDWSRGDFVHRVSPKKSSF
jgi:hypothetical protein